MLKEEKSRKEKRKKYKSLEDSICLITISHLSIYDNLATALKVEGARL